MIFAVFFLSIFLFCQWYYMHCTPHQSQPIVLYWNVCIERVFSYEDAMTLKMYYTNSTQESICSLCGYTFLAHPLLLPYSSLIHVWAVHCVRVPSFCKTQWIDRFFFSCQSLRRFYFWIFSVCLGFFITLMNFWQINVHSFELFSIACHSQMKSR